MKLVRTFGLILAAAVLVGSMAVPVEAQPKKEGETVVKTKYDMQPFAGSSWGRGPCAGLVIIGASIGFGKIGAAALESMARQPETAGRVQTAMIIIGAFWKALRSLRSLSASCSSRRPSQRFFREFIMRHPLFVASVVCSAALLLAVPGFRGGGARRPRRRDYQPAFDCV